MVLLKEKLSENEHTLLYYLEDPALVVSPGGKLAYANPALRSRFNIDLHKALKKPIAEVLPSWLQLPLLDHLGCLKDSEPLRRFRLGEKKSYFQAEMKAISQNGHNIGALVVLKEESNNEAVSKGNLELFRTMLDDLLYPLAEISSYLSFESGISNSFKSGLKNQVSALEEGISRMRGFSEVFFGRVRSERTPFYPGRILAMALKSLRPAAEQRKTRLIDGSARELPMVVSDPGLLSRVLSLLVDYIVREFPKGELVIVSADLIMNEKGAPWLNYSITGTGIIRSDVDLSRGEETMLENFSELPDDRKRMLLRVLLANKIISSMGGIITVAAHESVGMNINVAVPADIHYQTGKDNEA